MSLEIIHDSLCSPDYDGFLADAFEAVVNIPTLNVPTVEDLTDYVIARHELGFAHDTVTERLGFGDIVNDTQSLTGDLDGILRKSDQTFAGLIGEYIVRL